MTTSLPVVTKSVFEAPLSKSMLSISIFGAAPKISFPDPVRVNKDSASPAVGSKIIVILLAPIGWVLSQLPLPS